MSKFTPGPWVADLHIYPVMVNSQSETWPLVDELGNEEGRAGSFICNTGNNKANARLIAAAPDLLEALIHIEGAAMDIMCERRTIRDAARAAISKATGSAA